MVTTSNEEMIMIVLPENIQEHVDVLDEWKAGNLQLTYDEVINRANKIAVYLTCEVGPHKAYDELCELGCERGALWVIAKEKKIC